MTAKELSQRLREFLIERGAVLVGFADIEPFAVDGYPRAISFAIQVPPDIVRSMADGPTPAYEEEYERMNAQLNRMAEESEALLKELGYRAEARTVGKLLLEETPDFRTRLPHKTAATRAGLGWIGKCALLVNEEYGSGIRLSTVLTDAPLEVGKPVEASRCGSCKACQSVCPPQAILGNNWAVGIDRGELVKIVDCREGARDIAEVRLGKRTTLCGRCIAACPYTRRALMRSTPEVSIR